MTRLQLDWWTDYFNIFIQYMKPSDHEELKMKHFTFQCDFGAGPVLEWGNFYKSLICETFQALHFHLCWQMEWFVKVGKCWTKNKYYHVLNFSDLIKS